MHSGAIFGLSNLSKYGNVHSKLTFNEHKTMYIYEQSVNLNLSFVEAVIDVSFENLFHPKKSLI